MIRMDTIIIDNSCQFSHPSLDGSNLVYGACIFIEARMLGTDT